MRTKDVERLERQIKQVEKQSTGKSRIQEARGYHQPQTNHGFNSNQVDTSKEYEKAKESKSRAHLFEEQHEYDKAEKQYEAAAEAYDKDNQLGKSLNVLYDLYEMWKTAAEKDKKNAKNYLQRGIDAARRHKNEHQIKILSKKISEIK